MKAVGAEAAGKAEEAKKAAEAAAARAEKVARAAEEAAKEAVAKAEAAIPAALVKKIIYSREMLAILIIVFLGAVFSAVLISTGLLFGT